MEFLGYIAAVLMGAILGTLGAGGSILTVPILVYIFNVSPSIATAYSLFVVGSVSIFGALQYYTAKEIDIKTGLIFAIPAFMGVYFTRSYVVPSLPSHIATLGTYSLSKDALILIVFAIVMIVASVSMIRSRPIKHTESSPLFKIAFIGIEGLIVGGITGFVGAGGGFLIIPALVIFAGLDMKIAVGTSLFIISIKSLIGFIGDIQQSVSIDWRFLLLFTGVSLFGMILGTLFSKKIPSKKLKPIFGWFVLVMGIGILFKEIL